MLSADIEVLSMLWLRPGPRQCSHCTGTFECHMTRNYHRRFPPNIPATPEMMR